MPDILPFFTGFAAAVAHVLSGPDHLAAVTPLALDESRQSWKIGWWWGWGHLTGMLAIGAAVYGLKEWLPLRDAGRWSEKLVGILLLGLGIWILLREIQIPRGMEKTSFLSARSGRKWYAFGFGVVHGVAGLSHVVWMLPVLAWSLGKTAVYLAGFGAGTLSAMSLYAAVIGKWGASGRISLRWWRRLSAWAAIGVGIWWLIRN
ncbi:MAG: sulfite exporter TauE/SafE family protein [Chlorobi bacterium]|nr:sulfite exporter TauE/SafE family protein [Chlorobiota bacterium]